MNVIAAAQLTALVAAVPLALTAAVMAVVGGVRRVLGERSARRTARARGAGSGGGAA